MADLRDLRERLVSIRAGELAGVGAYPVVYLINERLISGHHRLLQDWTD